MLYPVFAFDDIPVIEEVVGLVILIVYEVGLPVDAVQDILIVESLLDKIFIFVGMLGKSACEVVPEIYVVDEINPPLFTLAYTPIVYVVLELNPDKSIDVPTLEKVALDGLVVA